MVPFGWFLNAYYYLLRYESEGFSVWVKYALAIGLVIFASICFIASQVFLKYKNIPWFIVSLIVYIILALYSINCTTAGQYWEQQLKNQEIKKHTNKQDNQSALYKLYKKQLERAENEFEKLDKIKYKSIDDLSDRYYYKNTTKSVEKRQTELQEQIKDYEKKIESILSENIISANQQESEQSKQLYEFYSNLIFKSKNNTEFVQFIFQILLSILIELIAQISIYIFMQINNFSPVIKEKMIITKEDIHAFTKMIYLNIMAKKSEYFLDKNVVLKLMDGKFNEKKYDHLVKAALKNKLMIRDKKTKKYKPENSFIDRSCFYKNMCDFFKIKLDALS